MKRYAAPKQLPPTAHVFGNEVGDRVPDIRTEWEETCEAGNGTGLKYHDLRREFGSRLLETPGVSVHHVRDALGHADLKTTSRYLATTIKKLADVMRPKEQHRAAGFAQDSHKPPADQPHDEASDSRENPSNLLN